MRGAALLALVAVLAPASPVGAAADPVGFSCGWVAVEHVDERDPVFGSTGHYTGYIDCPPWTAFDLVADDGLGPSETPSAARIERCAWLQVDQPYYGDPADGLATYCSASVVDGVMPWGVQLIEYDAQVWHNIYMCTEITMADDDGVTVYRYDGWDRDDVVTCGLATS